MIDRIKAFFGDRQGRGSAPNGRHSPDELHFAAAVLMVEAARLDGNFEAAERAKISELLCDRFGLAADESEALIGYADTHQDENFQLLPYTRIVKERFDEQERIELLEMLWEVAYADGELHEYEDSLLRRIGGLIYVPDRERGAAKQRVLSRRLNEREGNGKQPDPVKTSEVKE